jgi:hypothetical protein
VQHQSAIHTSLREGRWVNTREGSTGAIGDTYASQAEAVTVAHLVARRDRAEHVIHRADGSIHEITLTG